MIFGVFKSIIGETSGFEEERTTSKANEFSLFNRFNSFTFDATILGSSRIFSLLRVISS